MTKRTAMADLDLPMFWHWRTKFSAAGVSHEKIVRREWHSRRATELLPDVPDEVKEPNFRSGHAT